MGSDPAVGECVILFDGVCNLCNASVQFVIRHDSRSIFKFAALQSNAGRAFLDRSKIREDQLSTIILFVGQKFYYRSDAVLEIARRLSGLWPCFYAFKIIPRFLRDLVYRWVSNNRYKLFGRRDSCMIPTPALRARFLD